MCVMFTEGFSCLCLLSPHIEAAAIAAALNAASNPVALAAASTVNPQVALQAAAAAIHAQVSTVFVFVWFLLVDTMFILLIYFHNNSK